MFKRLSLLLLCLAATAVRACRGRRLSEPRHQDGGAVRARRRHRRARPHHRPASVREMGPAGGGGKPARRLRRHRHQGLRQGGAGRLHAADGLDRRADGGLRGAGAGRPFRRREILRADHRGGGAALSAGGQSERAGQFGRRIDQRSRARSRRRCHSARRASAPPRICRARCSRRTRMSNCCTCPTRAPARRSPISWAGAST